MVDHRLKPSLEVTNGTHVPQPVHDQHYACVFADVKWSDGTSWLGICYPEAFLYPPRGLWQCLGCISWSLCKVWDGQSVCVPHLMGVCACSSLAISAELISSLAFSTLVLSYEPLGNTVAACIGLASVVNWLLAATKAYKMFLFPHSLKAP